MPPSIPAGDWSIGFVKPRRELPRARNAGAVPFTEYQCPSFVSYVWPKIVIPPGRKLRTATASAKSAYIPRQLAGLRPSIGGTSPLVPSSARSLAELARGSTAPTERPGEQGGVRLRLLPRGSLAGHGLPLNRARCGKGVGWRLAAFTFTSLHGGLEASRLMEPLTLFRHVFTLN